MGEAALQLTTRSRAIPFVPVRRHRRRTRTNGMRYWLFFLASLVSLFTIQASWMGSQKQFKTLKQGRSFRTARAIALKIESLVHVHR